MRLLPRATAPRHAPCMKLPGSCPPQPAPIPTKRLHHPVGTIMMPLSADPSEQGVFLDSTDPWERLQELNQQLDAAVQAEDFKLAAVFRDRCKALKERMSPVQQYLYHQLQQLRSGTAEERRAAVSALRETGSEACLPHLAACLQDPQLNGAADAAMWSIFTRSSQPRSNELMQQGMRFMTNGNDMLRALEVFEQLIHHEPGFAEAHNKRATVLYLLGRHQESIEVCRTVLSLNPYHFGAASGMGLCHLQLQQKLPALEAFRLALRINPGMQQIRQYIAVLEQQLAEAQSEE